MTIYEKTTFPRRSDFPIGALDRLFCSVQAECPEILWLGGSALRNILVESDCKEGSDVDVYFFNSKERSKSYESEIEAELRERSGIEFLSVKNQARMGPLSDGLEYDSLLQSVAAFPDISVAMAARVMVGSTRHTALIFAPYGLPTKNSCAIRPTRSYLARHGLSGYYSWVDRKKYSERMVGWDIDNDCRAPSKIAFYSIGY